jgi:hypothetical protein
MNESQKQFSFTRATLSTGGRAITRAALSTGGRAKTNVLSIENKT